MYLKVGHAFEGQQSADQIFNGLDLCRNLDDALFIQNCIFLRAR